MKSTFEGDNDDILSLFSDMCNIVRWHCIPPYCGGYQRTDGKANKEKGPGVSRFPSFYQKREPARALGQFSPRVPDLCLRYRGLGCIYTLHQHSDKYKRRMSASKGKPMEGTGFEPAVDNQAHTRSSVRRIRPLSHPSASYSNIWHLDRTRSVRSSLKRLLNRKTNSFR